MIFKSLGLGKGFGGALRYVNVGKKNSPDANKASWSITRNLFAANYKKQSQIMAITAKQNKRVKLPLYHAVMSFHKLDNPNRELMETAALKAIKDLELEQHQIAVVAHHDTENPHLHFIINRVNPNTGAVWKPSHDFYRLRDIAREIENQHGLVRTAKQSHHKPRQASRPEQKRAERLKIPVRDVFSAEKQEAIVLRLNEGVTIASNWEALRERLAVDGYEIERKGQGLVLHNGSHEMKWSKFGKQNSLKALTEQYGQTFDGQKQQIPTPTPQSAVQGEETARRGRSLSDLQEQAQESLPERFSKEEQEQEPEQEQ